MTRRRDLAVALGIALAALGVRLVHQIAFAQASPFYDPAPWNTPANPLDTGEYDRWGMQIAGGDWWWRDHGQGHYFQSPVYPYFVAAIYALTGRWVFGVTLLQALLGAAGAGVLACTARRHLSPIAGWVAGGVAALAAPALFYETFLLKEPLATFLVAVALAATLATFGPRAAPPAPNRRWRRWLLVGVAWGAAVATWPVLAPAALGVLGWGVWRAAGPPGARAAGEASLAAGFLVCGMLLAVFPCTVRNVVGEGRFVLISDAGPRNWDVGNSVNSTGTYIDFPKERLAVLSPAFARLYVRKLGYFLHDRDLPQVTDHALLRDASPVTRLPLPGFGLLLAAAIAGAALLDRERRGDLFPAGALLVLYPATVAAFFVVGRFRLPLLPALALLAGGGVEAGLRRWRAGGAERLRLGAALAVGLGVLVLVHLPVRGPGGTPPFHHAWAQYWLEMGEIQATNRRDAAALAAYGQVLRLPSRHYAGIAHLGLADLHTREGRRAEAIRELRLSLEADPKQPEAERVRAMLRRLEEGG